MLKVLVTLSFLTGFTFIYGLFYLLSADRLILEKRLNRIKQKFTPEDEFNEELQRSFWERVIRPSLQWISFITRKFTPVKKRADLDRKLVLAGSPLGLNSNEFMSLYYAMSVIFGLFGFGFAFIGSLDGFSQVLYGLGGLILGYIIVEIWLRIKTQKRQEAILKGLPDLLDLLTVSVEAGLGFDAALSKVVQKIKGRISLEFSGTLQEIRMGKQRKDALRDLGLRAGVEELDTFISAVIQADQLGISIGNVLRVQSNQQRNHRRQKIEEKAMKAPVKMLLPMVLFIFPTIFIVLLGPAVIQIMNDFAK